MFEKKFILIVLVVVCAAASSRADDTHSAAPPVGDRAIGLAGAFTAVADDASATFYNPAGLVFQGETGIAAGLTLVEVTHFELDAALETLRGSVPLQQRHVSLVPTFAAAAKGFRPSQSGYRIALGYSVFQNRQHRVFDAVLRDGLTDTTHVDSASNATSHGLSAAFMLSDRLSVGTTLFVRTQTFQHTETSILSAGGVFDPARNRYVDVNIFARDGRLHGRVLELASRLGVMFRARPHLTFGAMVQVPALRLTEKAIVHEQIGATVLQAGPDQNSARVSFFDERASGVRSPLPVEVHTGVALQLTSTLLLAGDVALAFPVPGGPRVTYNEPVDSDQVPVTGMFFANSTRRRFVANGAVGVEWDAGRYFTVRGGVFTDLSSAPAIPAAPTSYQPERIHRFGLAGSVGVKLDGFVFNVGATFRAGTGSGVGAVGDLDEAALGYARRDARDQELLITISGAIAAAKRVGRWAFDR